MSKAAALMSKAPDNKVYPEDEIAAMAKDSDSVHGQANDAAAQLEKIIDEFVGWQHILEEFDKSKKTISELKAHRGHLVELITDHRTHLEELAKQIFTLTNDAEELAGTLDNFRIPEPEFDQDELDRLQRIEYHAGQYIQSRERGLPTEAWDFEDLRKAVEELW